MADAPDGASRRPSPDTPAGLVDVHTHVGASDTGQIWYPEYGVADAVRAAAAAGVAVSWAFAPQRTDGYAAATAALLDVTGATGGGAAGTAGQAAGGDGASGQAEGPQLRAVARLGGVRVPLPNRPPQLWQVRRAARARVLHALGRHPAPRDDVLGHVDGGDGGDGRTDGQPAAGARDLLDEVVAVKLAPHLDGLPDADVLARVVERRLPVVVHGGQHVPPAWVRRVLLPRLPECPVVLAHLGVFPLAAPLLDDALDLVREHPRVVLDTSGVWSTDLVRRAVLAAPDQVVFGSDAPLAHPQVAWDHVASAVRDDGLLQRVGVENAARVLGAG